MNPAPTIGVLALQGDVREHSRMLEELGARVRRVRSAIDLEGLDGLVLPGGESTTIAQLAERWGVLDPLRNVVRSGMPAFGTCAGLILLADEIADAKVGQKSIGGLHVTARRNAFGRQVDSFEQDLVIPAIGARPCRAVFIRAPAVEGVGPEVEVLAHIEEGPAAGRIVAVRQGSILATSFHPELTSDTRVHALFLDMVAQASG